MYHEHQCLQPAIHVKYHQEHCHHAHVMKSITQRMLANTSMPCIMTSNYSLVGSEQGCDIVLVDAVSVKVHTNHFLPFIMLSLTFVYELHDVRY